MKHFCKSLVVLFLVFFSCTNDDSSTSNPDENNNPEGVIKEGNLQGGICSLPVVIHVLHQGEPIGEGSNISDERIFRQIEILNEDYRRKKGTKGHNEHPDGGDAKIEFVLAKKDPKGNTTIGINRIDISDIKEFTEEELIDTYASVIYWNPKEYINIWVAKLGDVPCVLPGKATLPEIEYPGLSVNAGINAEGIYVNHGSFGEVNTNCAANKFGRTLTHEMGHYLGLLHTWNDGYCGNNDYCDDTPAVDNSVTSSKPYLGCKGEKVMIANYMNWTPDEIMNIFTNDQITRMHYVLNNHEGRKALLSSPALK